MSRYFFDALGGLVKPMSNNQQILVILEPDNHPLEVIERTSWIAAQNGFDVTLLWCDPDVGPLGTHFFVSNEARDIGKEIRAVQDQIVEDLAKPLKEKGLSVSTGVLEERPIAEGVLRHVLEMNPAYLVKGTQYHDAAERAIFVDTDWHLMRSCTCPLWLVKTGKMPDKPLIIAAVDPMHSHDKPAALDQVIVDNARRIAATTDGEVHLLRIFPKLSRH